MCGERFTERQSLITHIEEHKRNGLLMYFNLIDGKMSNATPAQQVDSACQQMWLLCYCFLHVISPAVKFIDIAAPSWKCPIITHMEEKQQESSFMKLYLVKLVMIRMNMFFCFSFVLCQKQEQ